MSLSNQARAYFVIISTIIGLGVFVLPYTLARSGYYFIFWILFWFLAFFILHLLFGEILFQTKEKHNLPGLGAIYLHPYFKHIIWIFDYFGTLGVFLIYLIAIKEFWSIILPVNPIIIKLVFLLFNIYFILKEITIFAKFETYLSLGILSLFLFISFFILPGMNIDNLVIALKNTENPLLPYGTLLFALSGISALPLVYDLVGQDKKAYLKVNFLALLTVVILYLFYAFVVTGFLGLNVSEESFKSLAVYLPKSFLVLAILLVTLNITFVDFAFYLKRGLMYDYGFSKNLTHFLIIISLLPLAFWEPLNLISLIELISTLFSGFIFFFICLIYLRIKEKKFFKIPSFLVILLSLILLLGILKNFF